MVAPSQRVGAAFAKQHRAHRQAAAQPFGKGNDVRHDASVLKGKQPAAAADAGLHFVGNQQHVVAAAQLAGSLKIAGIQRGHAAFALHRLEHQRGDVVLRQARFKGGGVVGGNVGETFDEGEKMLVENVLAGGGKGGEGAAVEGVLQGENGVAAGTVAVAAVFARGFDGAFVGFGAAVAEKDAGKTAFFAETLRQLGSGDAVEKVGSVRQFARLRGDGGNPCRIGKAEAIDADAAGEVGVGAAVGIPDGAAFAAHQHRREAGVGGSAVLLVELADVVGKRGGHAISF